MIPGNANPLLLASAAAAAAVEGPIKSLRFNSSDSANLHRTPSSAGNRKTWTFAAWIKLSDAGTSDRQVFSTRVSGTAQIQIGQSGSALIGFSEFGIFNLRTSRLMRDPGAWFHLCCVFDSSNSTEGDRARIYVNGARETDFSAETYPSQNAEASWNRTERHNIGSLQPSFANYFDGYMADIYFVDGSALDPTSFGAYDDNGVWQAAAYSGTFGTNGFHLLDFENESTIGHDSSGNENDFTAVNFSTSAGAGNDVLFDVPTNGTQSDTGAGGEVSGNYCTLNELYHPSTLSNGGLDYVSGASNIATVQQTGTIGVSSGKYYFEVTCTASSGSFTDTWFIGLVKSDFDEGTTVYNQSNNVLYYAENGQKYVNSSNSSYGASYTNNDVIGVAADLTGNTIEFFKNGSSQGSISYTFSGTYLPYISNGDDSSSVSATLNFGQRAFTHAAPSGYKTWNTASLPTPTIADSSEYFEAKLYTGNGGTNTITGLEFSPDWTWIKKRNSNSSHSLHDTVRGATKRLVSNNNTAETTETTALTAFTSDGFTLGSGGTANGNNDTFVSWNWDAASSTVSNTDGSITSSVRASATSGFSIVSWTGNATAGASVGHSLGAAPYLVVVKNRTDSNNWVVWHNDLGGGNKILELNTTSAIKTTTTPFNGTVPSSSVLTLGTNNGTNGSGDDMIAYCFAPVAGHSQISSWEGNGSTDGPFVHTGFRPAFILYKASDAAEHWHIRDTAREPHNVTQNRLLPSSNIAEGGDADFNIDILSNGFKLRASNATQNQNGTTYIYYAVAENPFSSNGGLAR